MARHLTDKMIEKVLDEIASGLGNIDGVVVEKGSAYISGDIRIRFEKDKSVSIDVINSSGESIYDLTGGIRVRYKKGDTITLVMRDFIRIPFRHHFE